MRLDIILQILDGSRNRMREAYFEKYHHELYQEILNFTRDVLDIPFKFRVWHWINNMDHLPLCYCGNGVTRHLNWQDGYREFCSAKCSANSSRQREKAKKTLLEKYGVDHYSKTDKWKDQVKETSIKRWGVDNFAKTQEYVEKSKKTSRNKWGCDSFTKTDEYRKKSKETLLQKYGVDSWIKTPYAKEKIKTKMLEKWNVKQIFLNEVYRKENFIIANDTHYIKYLENSNNQFKCDKNQDHIFEISTDNYFARKRIGNTLCTICNPIAANSSQKEDEVYLLIKSIYSGEIMRNFKSKYELDVFIPEKNIGIEFNGIWWHSDHYKDKNYHYEKTEYFKSLGIRVFHIWEDDWLHKKEIIESQLRYLLGANTVRIWARHCEVKLIETKEHRDFLNANHIQGWVRSIVKIGLFNNSELVAVMSFDNYEGRKRMSDKNWNLNRFCNKINTSVVGGASKLLKFFIHQYRPERIISYADKDWSTGNLYGQLGFELVSESKPDYKYLIDGKRIHKSRFRKGNLNYTEKESVFMESKGIQKVWDCGKIKFEMKNISYYS